MPRRAVIYARISVTQDTSVAIKRQVEAATQYAAARGWQIVGKFIDDGISATSNRPEDRTGWKALLDSPLKFDAVIIWKIDRLARKVLDFLQADQALKARKAGIVAVEDPLDMTTAQGRAFATLLAVFGELEASAISERVKAARTYLIRARRVVGGPIPYGWRSVRNPSGPGWVLATDPDRAPYVLGAVQRVQRGDSIYSVVQYLDEARAPAPYVKPPKTDGEGKPLTPPKPPRRTAGWGYSTVERMLRNPILCGMIPFNPGNTTNERGDDVLRGGDGLPVVDESIAIMSVAAWRAMITQLDNRTSAQSLPRAMKAKTSGLLSGLVECGEHDEPIRMYRGTTQGRASYSCPKCFQTISNFEHVVVAEFIRAKGERVRWTRIEEVQEGGAALLPEIEHRLDELDGLIRLAPHREERQRLQAEQANLLDLRDAKRGEAPVVSQRWDEAGWFEDEWAKAEGVEGQRAVLDDAMSRITVRRGGTGRRTDAQVLARLTIDWKVPEDLGPLS